MNATVSDLPSHAAGRLKELRSKNNPKGIFTSDLSVNEFLLVKEAGFEPLGLVIGSSVYHTGIQRAKWSKSMELETLTQAMYHARELAISRMEEEAQQLGADGIVAVRLEINEHAFAENVIEFIAIGTAVAANDSEINFKTIKGLPFTSDLSGQDFWTLLKAGYKPTSLVMGACVYHIAHQKMSSMFSNIGKNVELVNYTQALYDARELAMERMQHEAHELQSEGIVGVTVEEKNYSWSKDIIEFFAIGTSVTSIKEHHQIAEPSIVINLNAR